MTPVDQSKLHNVLDGVRGNCFAACLASILDVKINDVPAFEDMHPGVQWQEIRRYLKARGWCIISVRVADGGPLNLDEFYIGTGPSPREVLHSVVMRGAEMLHDPHPSRAGVASLEWAHVPMPLPENMIRARLGLTNGASR